MTSIVVVGDLILDRDICGAVTRLCPDAPVPVVDEQSVIERAGGAGLAATLARRHTDEVTLVANLADDDGGRRLGQALADADVDLVGLADPGRTIEKTRIRVAGHSVIRLDRGASAPAAEVPPAAASAIAAADALLVADYGQSTVRTDGIRQLVEAAIARGIPVVWDPHPRGGEPCAGVTLVTPNRSEADHFDRAAGFRAGGESIGPSALGPLSAQAHRLRQHWAARAVSVTLGGRGAIVATEDDTPLVVPLDDPVANGDTCGAGDAFAAACVAHLAGGGLLGDAVERAVSAASDFVRSGGASGLPTDAQRQQGALRPRPGRRVLVAAGGCFDVLHPGHVTTLQSARLLGDRLVVLINSDESVRRLKGPGRPVQCAENRAAVLRALGVVDEVVVFDEDTPVEALRALRADVFVKGGDYTGLAMPESRAMAEWGGVVVTVPYAAGHSTSRILHGITQTEQQTSDQPTGGAHAI